MIGIVITTFGDNYIIAKQCVMCFLRHLIDPYYIVLYINGTSNDKLKNIQVEFPMIDVVLLETPHPGGLTWTWNDGITKCVAKNCTSIVLSNDDILFDASIKHILAQSEACKKLHYFGPVTNNPGVRTNMAQKASGPSQTSTHICKYKSRVMNLNGFFMVFPTHCLIANKHDSDHFFDPTKPYGSNEVDWFKKFASKGGKPMIVPKTFVYHYKLKSWRQSVSKRECVFTINMNDRTCDIDFVNIKDYADKDCVAFIDQDSLIYTCLKYGIVPLLIKSEEYDKMIQLTIKSEPMSFLPPYYSSAIYKSPSDEYKYGVVITAITGELVFIRQLLFSLRRHIQTAYTLLYVHETRYTEMKGLTDQITSLMIKSMPTLDKAAIWNDATVECLNQKCSSMFFGDDNILIDSSIQAILRKSQTSTIACYGPISNVSSNKHQINPIGTDKDIPNSIALDDSCLVISMTSLLTTRLADGIFFRTNYLDWFKRFTGKSIIVPQTYVYRYNKSICNKCVYTVNTGGYEGTRILINGRDHKVDCLYFTDNEALIGKCISLNLIPFITIPSDFDKDARLVQRSIKASPHLFLPSYYEISLYIDGRVVLKREAESIIDEIKDKDLMCYHHHRNPYPPNVASEWPFLANKYVKRPQLEAMIRYMNEDGFNPKLYHLTETCILIRRHHNIIPFSEEWTRLIHIVHRDQVTFDYLLWKFKINYFREQYNLRPISTLEHVNPINRRFSRRGRRGRRGRRMKHHSRKHINSTTDLKFESNEST